MPRNVRNFWVTLAVDGRKTQISSGPRSRGGGFNLTISMRNRGDVESDVLIIKGRAIGSLLKLSVLDHSRGGIYARTTKT